MDFDNIMDLFIDNMKTLFFPEKWIELDLKFSKSELFTMLYLDKRKASTMTELVEYINTPMSTATGIVDRLVKKGYVIRDRSEADRRIVILMLTEEGMQLISSLKDIISGYLHMISDDLSEEERQFLTRIALKIMHNLQANSYKPSNADKEQENIKKIDIE